MVTKAVYRTSSAKQTSLKCSTSVIQADWDPSNCLLTILFLCSKAFHCCRHRRTFRTRATRGVIKFIGEIGLVFIHIAFTFITIAINAHFSWFKPVGCNTCGLNRFIPTLCHSHFRLLWQLPNQTRRYDVYVMQ